MAEPEEGGMIGISRPACFWVLTRLSSLHMFHLSLLDRAGTTTPFIWIPPTFPSFTLHSASFPSQYFTVDAIECLSIWGFILSSSAMSSARWMIHGSR